MEEMLNQEGEREREEGRGGGEEGEEGEKREGEEGEKREGEEQDNGARL